MNIFDSKIETKGIVVIMKDKEESVQKCSLIYLEPFLDNDTPFRVIMKDKEESNQNVR